MKYLLLFGLVSTSVLAIQTQAPRSSQDENHHEHVKDYKELKESAKKNQLKRQKREQKLNSKGVDREKEIEIEEEE